MFLDLLHCRPRSIPSPATADRPKQEQRSKPRIEISYHNSLYLLRQALISLLF